MVPDFLFHLIIIFKSDDIKYCTGVLVFLYFVHTKENAKENTKEKNERKNERQKRNVGGKNSCRGGSKGHSWRQHHQKGPVKAREVFTQSRVRSGGGGRVRARSATARAAAWEAEQQLEAAPSEGARQG